MLFLTQVLHEDVLWEVLRDVSMSWMNKSKTGFCAMGWIPWAFNLFIASWISITGSAEAAFTKLIGPLSPSFPNLKTKCVFGGKHQASLSQLVLSPLGYINFSVYNFLYTQIFWNCSKNFKSPRNNSWLILNLWEPGNWYIAKKHPMSYRISRIATMPFGIPPRLVGEWISR